MTIPGIEKVRPEWFRHYRTTLGAVLVTMAMVWLIALHDIAVGRAVVALSFVWVLALHSLDVNDHKEEVLEGLAKLGQRTQAATPVAATTKPEDEGVKV